MIANDGMADHTAETRMRDALGMLLIGDGVLGMLHPTQHCLIWRGGPGWWQETVEWFAARPAVTRAAALAELGAGLWLGSRGRALRSHETGAGMPSTQGIR